ncbi:hypothetical protein lerEdw1_015606 [Lerista edwardsae]|nr:hypothetical protein lerEdw1_015606 [Lerista edwardsae]
MLSKSYDFLQVSQYTFAMCSYREKKAEPQELLQLDGYTVDYTDPQPGLEGGRAFFNAVKEGDTVIFASDDEQDRILWVQAMYRATGQSHKPVPPTQVQKLNAKGGNVPQLDAPISQFSDLKHMMQIELKSMAWMNLSLPIPVTLTTLHSLRCFSASLWTTDLMIPILVWQHHVTSSNHYCVFETKSVFEIRSISIQGWFSPGQVFVLDEYCARNGVRGCHRHLCYLSDLLERAENGAMIDPTLLHYSFAFCASHVHGNSQKMEEILGSILPVANNPPATEVEPKKDSKKESKKRKDSKSQPPPEPKRPDGIGTVTVEEKERFEEIKERLRLLLENQITHFSVSCIKVLMKDIVTPVPQEEVKAVIRKCLEQAALTNYTRLSEYAKIEAYPISLHFNSSSCTTENVGRLVTPAKKLEDTIRLAELVIEVLQQNEEHHAEVCNTNAVLTLFFILHLKAFAWWSDLMVEHAETFLSLFAVDMDAALEVQPPDTWDSFPLFQLLNDSLRSDYNLCNGKYHKHLQDLFAPLVVRYVDLMESSIAQSIHRGFERESWEPVK